MRKTLLLTFFISCVLLCQSQTKKCHVDKSKDKVLGNVYKVAFANWARFTKIVKGSDTTYVADFWSEGFTEDRYNHGISFVFSDGTKHVRPDVDINCKLGPDGYYDFTCNFKLNKQDLEILSKKVIISFKLYNAERGIGVSQGINVQEGMTCLIKS